MGIQIFDFQLRGDDSSAVERLGHHEVYESLRSLSWRNRLAEQGLLQKPVANVLGITIVNSGCIGSTYYRCKHRPNDEQHPD